MGIATKMDVTTVGIITHILITMAVLMESVIPMNTAVAPGLKGVFIMARYVAIDAGFTDTVDCIALEIIESGKKVLPEKNSYASFDPSVGKVYDKYQFK